MLGSLPKDRCLWERLVNPPCNANIRQEHELLNKAIGFEKCFLLDINRVGRLRALKVDLYLRRGQIQRACSHPSRLQLLCQHV